MASISQVFLGWNRPLVHTAAEYLAHHFKVENGGVDLSRVTLIAPGARLGRHIIDEIARAHGAVLGEFLTIDRFVCGLVDPPHVPTDWLRRLAWVRAASELSTEERQSLWPPGVQNSPVQLLAMAHAIDTAARRLAGDAVSFQDALETVQEKDLPDIPRWQALNLLQSGFQRQLTAINSIDPWSHRVTVGKNAHSLHIGRVILVGMVEIPGLLRTILERAHGSVTTLIAAPEDRSPLFDRLGTADTKAWHNQTLPIDDASITVADGPQQQAQAAIVLAGADPNSNPHPRTPDSVVIAVPDEEVLDALELLGRSLEPPQDGRIPLRLRSLTGTSATQTSPARMLKLVSEFLSDPELPAFSKLLRHTDIETFIRAAARRRAGALIHHDTDLLGFLDSYGTEYVHASIDGTWLGRSVGRNAAGRAVLDAIYVGATELLDGLWSDNRPARERPISAWMHVIVGLVRRVFGTPAERRSLAAISAIESIARSLQAGTIFAEHEPRISPDAAIRIVLAELARTQIPHEPDASAVELLGWLDAVHDPAELLILTAMNEGCAPRDATADPLIPDSLRSALGLSTRQATLARDLCLLTQAMHMHPRVAIIAGRRRIDGSRLWPSRLLLASDDATVVRRLGWFLAEQLDPPPGPGMIPRLSSTAPASSAFSVMPVQEHAPLKSVSVTSFKRYMRSPYEFYLHDVLKLRDVPELALELEATRFGDFLHRILEIFGKGPVASSTDEAQIAAELERIARDVAEVDLGSSPPTAVAIQFEQAMYRLKTFAPWQAERARQGWSILLIEHEVKGGILKTPHGDLEVHGRIDRIDYNAKTNQIALIDYKSGESDGKNFKQMYREDSTSVFGPWSDLQLPLYRMLAKSIADEKGASITMGYVRMPKSGKVELLEGTWTPAQLDRGIEQAVDLAGRMLRGDWLTPGTASPDEGPIAALLGVSIILPAGDDDEGGDE